MEDTQKQVVLCGNRGLDNVALFALYLGIGLTSWLLTNSLFIQVPNFATILPEGYAIASQISVIIQISNLFALLYVFLFKYIKIRDWVIILFLQLIAITTSFALAFGWDVIWYNHSILLLCLSGACGFVGCMAVVVFYPFAAKSSPVLTSAISLGMGLTGLISSVLGIIQTIHPFSVTWYFLYNSFILIGSLASFLMVLAFTKASKNNTTELIIISDLEENRIYLDTSEDEEKSSEKSTDSEYSQTTFSPVTICNFTKYLIVCQLVNCFIYYLLLGTVPYAFSTFSDSSQLLSATYNWGMVFGSLGRFLCTFRIFRTKSRRFILFCTIFQYLLGLFIFLQCVVVWVDHTWIWTVIGSYILLSAINGYEDTLLYQVAAIIQENPKNIERITRYIGLSNQGGAFCGSMLSFLLIEFGWLG